MHGPAEETPVCHLRLVRGPGSLLGRPVDRSLDDATEPARVWRPGRLILLSGDEPGGEDDPAVFKGRMLPFRNRLRATGPVLLPPGSSSDRKDPGWRLLVDLPRRSDRPNPSNPGRDLPPDRPDPLLASSSSCACPCQKTKTSRKQ